MADVYWIGGSGTQDLSVVGNYSTGALPSAGDTLWFQQGNSNIATNLSALSAIALAAINVTAGFSGTIGTAANSNDALVIGAGSPAVNIDATNSGRIVIDFGAQTHTTTVTGGGPAADAPLETVRIRGGSTSSKLYVTAGVVGVATSRPGLTANLAEFDLSSGSTIGTARLGGTSTATLNLGLGVTWAGGTQDGGTLSTSTGTTGTLTQVSGTLTTNGTGKITNLDIGGTANLNHRPASGSAVDTLYVRNNGVADWSGNPAPFTITNAVNIYSGAELDVFNQANSTFTAGIHLIKCGLSDVKLNLGSSITLSVAAG